MLIDMVTNTSIKLIVCGLVAHWVFDWLLQNHWMAQNKASLLHPASWVHSGIHLLGLLVVFYPIWWVAVLIGITHILIDTRVPLIWWRKFYKQTTTGDAAMHVAMWGDQVLHVTVLAIAALIVGGLK
jgi:hypothetical protein